MNTTERNYLLNLLKESQTALFAAIEDVAEESFLQKPAEDKWSIAEIVEHLITTDTGLLYRIQKEGKTIEEVVPQTLSNDKLVKVVTSRDIKAKAPSFLVPQGRFKSKADAVAAFEAIRSKVINFVETTELPLEKITFKHFLLGSLDAKGWVAFMAGHCQRHTLQIEELKQG
ncbi:MAG: DinB family protein [Chitinophagales bacterium]